MAILTWIFYAILIVLYISGVYWTYALLGDESPIPRWLQPLFVIGSLLSILIFVAVCVGMTIGETLASNAVRPRN